MFLKRFFLKIIIIFVAIISVATYSYFIKHPVLAQTSLTQCGYLDQANTTYVLQNNVNSNGTCFAIIAQNVVLDLNGKTITYDNSAPITIPNSDFESGGATADSWDFANAPNAQRIAGTFVQPQTVFSGTYAVKIPIPASNQLIKSTNQITLEPNTTYSLSAMAHSTVAGSYSIYVGLDGTGINASTTGQTWYFQFIRTTFTTGSTPISYNVVAGISGATGASAGNVYIDDIQIQRYRTAGVAVGPQSWAPGRVPDINRYGNAKNAVIKNGSIVQGNDKGDDSHAIVSEGGGGGLVGSGLEIANLTITVNGPSSKAIYLNDGDNINIHDNIINSAVDVIKNRHQRDGALIKFEYDGGGSLIHHNTITSGIQNGIIAGTKSGAVLNQIYQNNITLQTKYTNDFAIAGRGLIYENTINCGSGNNSCRGIFGNSDSKIYNNIIDVQQLLRNQEYDGCEAGGAYGIQIEYASNTEVYNNTVTARANQCDSAAFRNNPTSEETATLGDVGINNYVHDNAFTAIKTGSVSNVAAQGIRISNLNRADSLRFENNTVTTNSQWLQGTSGVSLVQFKSNTFKTTTPMPSSFLPFYTYDWNPPTSLLKDIKFIDNKYLDSETKNLFENASIICTYATSGISSTSCAIGGTNPIDKYSSFYYSWTLSVNVKDGANASISNAVISISNTQGNVVFSGTTDSGGVASAVLDEFKNAAGVKTSSNPYTITISKSGYNSYSGQITMDSSKNISVNLENGTVSDTTPPAAPTGLAVQ